MWRNNKQRNKQSSQARRQRQEQQQEQPFAAVNNEQLLTSPTHTPPSSPKPLDIDIPEEITAEGQHRVWSNNIVLIFERPHTERQAREWLYIYNQLAEFKLQYIDIRHNQLYVVKIETNSDTAVQQDLILRLPLLANNTYASVNLYHRNFKDTDSTGLKHLITVTIKNSDPEIYEYFKFVVAPIGR
jgi:hypothetical protein